MPILSQKMLLALSGVSLVIALLGLSIGLVSILKIRKLKKTNETLLSGKDGKSLESTIIKHSQDIKELDKEIQELFEISNTIHRMAQKSIHKVGLVRFNPFKDIGGDQSFALSLLNGKKDGIIISSLHTREGARIYVKPVRSGLSNKHQLTKEELDAINSASLLEASNIKEV
jgi:hypothetical protein